MPSAFPIEPIKNNKSRLAVLQDTIKYRPTEIEYFVSFNECSDS